MGDYTDHINNDAFINVNADFGDIDGVKVVPTQFELTNNEQGNYTYTSNV